MPAEVIGARSSLPGFHVFQRQLANFPWRSHADWFLAQMVRWEQVAADTDIKAVADRVYRTDIYRAAARELGVSDCPQADRLPPGGHGLNRFPKSDNKTSEDFLVQESNQATMAAARASSDGAAS